jgi:hypothetical protein
VLDELLEVPQKLSRTTRFRPVSPYLAPELTWTASSKEQVRVARLEIEPASEFGRTESAYIVLNEFGPDYVGRIRGTAFLRVVDASEHLDSGKLQSIAHSSGTAKKIYCTHLQLLSL